MSTDAELIALLREIAENRLALWVTTTRTDPRTGAELAQPQILSVQPEPRPTTTRADWWRVLEARNLIRPPHPGEQPRYHLTDAGATIAGAADQQTATRKRAAAAANNRSAGLDERHRQLRRAHGLGFAAVGLDGTDPGYVRITTRHLQQLLDAYEERRRGAATAPNGRGTCSVCGTPRSLRVGGLMPQHQTPGDPIGPACPGGGELPSSREQGGGKGELQNG